MGVEVMREQVEVFGFVGIHGISERMGWEGKWW